jgi:hypothetical protein
LQRPGGPRNDLLVDAPTPDTHGEDELAAKLAQRGGFHDQTNYLQLLKPWPNGWGFCLTGTNRKTALRRPLRILIESLGLRSEGVERFLLLAATEEAQHAETTGEERERAWNWGWGQIGKARHIELRIR